MGDYSLTVEPQIDAHTQKMGLLTVQLSVIPNFQIFGLFPYLFFICCVLKTQPEVSSAVLLVTVVRTCYAFGLVFTICSLGQKLTKKFDEITDLFGQFDWYLFSDEINQMLLTITAILQRSIALDCFGSLKLGHEAFKKVSSIKFKATLHRFFPQGFFHSDYFRN